jgi:hypothetical protein
MQFFTEPWLSGDLDGDEELNVIEQYHDHLATFDRDGQLYRLATTISLHDAYLDRLTIDNAAGRIDLLLLTGDLQVGYWRTMLSYSSARIATGKSTLSRGLSSRPTEILYDEFTRTAEGLSHGFLVAPRRRTQLSGGEFRIDFQDFSFRQEPADGRSLATIDDQSVWS